MEATNNDLSYDLTKLDFEAMLKTASIARYRCTVEVERELALIHSDPQNSGMQPTSVTYQAANRLALIAKQLAIVSETEYTLLQSQTRSRLRVINRIRIRDRI